MDFFFGWSRQWSCRASSKLGLGAVMKKLFFANAAFAALIAAPAMAADMPIAAPPVYKAPFSWSGCYGGFNAGFIGSLDRYDNSPSGAYSTILTPAQIAQGQTSRKPDVGSYIGGVQLGCNYQGSSVVWGVEGDFNAHAGSVSTTRTGWTAGGGVEWTVAANWSMNFEYLYLDFGTWSYLSPNTSFFGGPAAPPFTWTTNLRTREQVARIGINYKLGPSFANY